MSFRKDDFDSTVDSAERANLSRIGSQLEDERPIPRARFRGDLRRHLMAQASERRFRTPRERRRLAIACLVSGSALLSLAALGLADAGPLGPSTPADAAAWIGSALNVGDSL